MVVIAALFLAPAAVAGAYQARQMEVGAALELKKNGHFRYQLDYGAVSERAEGNWTFDGKTVRLTTRPAPDRPSFELVRDEPAPEGEIVLTVEPPGFGAEGYRLRAIGTDAESGEKGLVTTDDQGRVAADGRKLSAVEPLVPVYGTPGGPVPPWSGPRSPPAAAFPCQRSRQGRVRRGTIGLDRSRACPESQRNADSLYPHVALRRPRERLSWWPKRNVT